MRDIEQIQRPTVPEHVAIRRPASASASPSPEAPLWMAVRGGPTLAKAVSLLAILCLLAGVAGCVTSHIIH